MTVYDPAYVGIALRAFPGSAHCGDQCGIWHNGEKTVVCIVDGLGHGRGAAEAAKAAVEYVSSHLDVPLPELFEGCDAAIRETRGVAMAVAIIDTQTTTLTYACIGNTRAAIIGTVTSQITGDPGIIGGGFSHLLVDTYSFGKGAVIVLWSDGIDEFIDFKRYRSSIRDSAQDLANHIINDLSKSDDDSSVVAFKNRKA